MNRRALFSVSDKTGVADFAKRVEALGYEIISTGGTQKELESAGVKVKNVSDITGFPECLDGRLKTLHPKVHGGILAMRSSADHMAQMELLDIAPIDLVVINLYPFKQTILREDVQLDEAIENIDIGGPTMIRAAAKNWPDVVVVVDPADYESVVAQMEGEGVPRERRFALAYKVFEHTAHYDALIAEYLRREVGIHHPETLTLTYEKGQTLRYGENPHQKACFYKEVGGLEGSLCLAEQLHGKEMSFLNYADTDAAIAILREFSTPCAVAVKHANPCGVGWGESLSLAFDRCFEADPVSIFGGIVALNRTCDKETAQKLGKVSVLDIIIAPAFSEEALDILTKRKHTRLLALETIDQCKENTIDLKKIQGGLLLQDGDAALYTEESRVVTERAPTAEERAALDSAWRICKYVKSNAITLVKENRSAGIGAGQTNRVAALDIAIRNAGDHAKGSVMASDAYFPFADSVETAAKAGITAIIQPGGSIRDKDSIEAANKAGIAMIFTGTRHFKH